LCDSKQTNKQTLAEFIAFYEKTSKPKIVPKRSVVDGNLLQETDYINDDQQGIDSNQEDTDNPDS
jgi:hypothetical protein